MFMCTCMCSLPVLSVYFNNAFRPGSVCWSNSSWVGILEYIRKSQFTGKVCFLVKLLHMYIGSYNNICKKYVRMYRSSCFAAQGQIAI